MGQRLIKKGDTVTRGCNDRHIVKDIDYGCGLITVECTKIQDGSLQWSEIGEEDNNLIRRYSLVENGVRNE